MPLYEYICDECGESVEQLRAFGDHLTHCKSCKGLVRQVFGPVMFKFKSPNWKPYSVEGSIGEESIKEELAIG